MACVGPQEMSLRGKLSPASCTCVVPLGPECGAHLLGLLDLGEASVKDSALIREVNAIEFLHNLLVHQLLCPAVWPIDDHQPAYNISSACSAECAPINGNQPAHMQSLACHGRGRNPLGIFSGHDVRPLTREDERREPVISAKSIAACHHCGVPFEFKGAHVC